MEPQVEARQSKVTARWTFLSLHRYLRLSQGVIDCGEAGAVVSTSDFGPRGHRFDPRPGRRLLWH